MMNVIRKTASNLWEYLNFILTWRRSSVKKAEISLAKIRSHWLRNWFNQRVNGSARGNLMFFSDVLYAGYLNMGNFTHSFRRLELRNDSTRQDDKARQCDFQNSGRRHVENWKSSSSRWRIRFYRVSRNRMAFLPSNRKELWHDIELLTWLRYRASN